MPFIIPLIGSLLGAIFFMCLAYVIDQIASYLDSAIPNPGAFGFHPLGFVHSLLVSTHNWVVGISATYGLVIHDLVGGLGYLWKRLEAMGVSAFGAAFGLIEHLHSAEIPAARNAAEIYAHGQAAGEQVRATGAEATITADLHQTAINLQNNINTLQNTTVPADIAAEKAAVLAQLHQAQTNLQNNIDGLSTSMAAQLSNVWNNIAPLQTAVGVTIPEEFSSAAQATKNAISDAKSAEQAALTAGLTALQGQITAIDGEITKQNGVIATAQGAITTLNKTSTTYGADLIRLNGTITAAQGSITALKTTASGLQGQITKSRASITTLEATRTITLPALPDITFPTDITVPVAVGALAVAVSSIISEIDRCMVTACEGPNNYRNLFNDIMGGIDIAGLIGFLAAAAHDPEGEARSLAGVASGIYNDGHALIDSLLSL